MATNLKIELAHEKDINELISIISPCFQNVPVEALMFGEPTPENMKNKAAQHLKSWRTHAEESSLHCAIKCVYTDPDTSKSEIAGCAEWFTFDRKRTAEQYLPAPHLLSAAWMENEIDKLKAVKFNKPIVDKRNEWMAGHPHAVLRYMSVAPKWRRKGIATMCVQWGVDRCKELGIPAYLEASDEGVPVYEKLGFDKVDVVEAPWEGEIFTYPVMIWWPENMEKIPQSRLQ